MIKDESIEIKRILGVFKEKLIIIVLVLIASILLGYIYSYYYIVPKYKSTETLLLIPNNETEEQRITSSDLILNSGLISTYSNIAKEPKVLRQVINNLKLNMSEKELLSKLKVNVAADTYIIEISISDVNPQRATDITSELSNIFLKEIKEIYNLENIGIVDEAEVPTKPYNINHIKDMIMFFVMGIFASCVIIILTIILDNTIKTEKDIEEYIELKSLGKIPMNLDKKEEIVDRTNAKSYVTECINTIRTNILYMNSVKTAKTILVTSCREQEGKSWTSANIATSFAETNKKVLLIDADLRKGRSNKIFNIEETEGLSNYLYFMTGETRGDLELAEKYIKETEVPNLHILTNGNIPPNPAELLESSNMKALLAMLKKLYDIIIIDSPPCMLVTDSVILSTVVDSTILVANSESTKINELIKVNKSIEMVGGNLIGAILNKAKIEGKTYSKSYYYGHADIENKCELKKREIITVKELIKDELSRLEINEKVFDKSIEIVEEKNENNSENKTVDNTEQNKYLQKIIDVISELKIQLNRNQNINIERFEKEERAIEEITEIINSKVEELRHNSNIEIYRKLKDINYKEELDTISNEIKRIDTKNISEEIKKLDNSEKIDKLSNELDNLKSKVININYGKELEKAYNEIIKIKEYNKQLIGEVKDKSYIDNMINNIEKMTVEEVEAIVEEKVLTTKEIESIIRKGTPTKEEISEIISQNTLTIGEIANIVEKTTISKEEIEDIISKQKLDKREIQNIIKQEKLTDEQIEYIINKNKLTIEQVQKIVKQELQSINYTNQFNKLEEMILNLKEDYLELSNKINKEQFIGEDFDTVNNENIININLFRKNKQTKKKRKSYSIDEDIEYTDLEESAICIIPFETNNLLGGEYKKTATK